MYTLPQNNYIPEWKFRSDRWFMNGNQAHLLFVEQVSRGALLPGEGTNTVILPELPVLDLNLSKDRKLYCVL